MEKQRECTVAATRGTSSQEETVLKEEAKKTLPESDLSSKPSTLQEEEEQQLPLGGPASAPVEEAMETSEMLYFPAHPFSIFPPDTESTAAITMETAPHQSELMEEGNILVALAPNGWSM